MTESTVNDRVHLYPKDSLRHAWKHKSADDRLGQTFPCHIFTMSRFYYVTFLLCHVFTMSGAGKSYHYRQSYRVQSLSERRSSLFGQARCANRHDRSLHTTDALIPRCAVLLDGHGVKPINCDYYRTRHMLQCSLPNDAQLLHERSQSWVWLLKARVCLRDGILDDRNPFEWSKLG